MDIKKEEVLASLEAELQRQKDMRQAYAIVSQILEKYNGKRITKAIEKKLQDRFGEKYRINYYRDEPYEQRVWVRKMHGSKAIFELKVILHHESFGREFSMKRYLDNDNHLPYVIKNIHEIQQTIEQLDTTYPLFERALIKFEESTVLFGTIMGKTKVLYAHVNRDTQEFIRKHT